jgi:hypothetical protein
MLKLLELLEECRRGNHDLMELLEANAGFDASHVARWCRRCGATVVDLDYDNRTNAGQVMKMRSPEFLKQAIVAIHRQLLGELTTTLSADLTGRFLNLESSYDCGCRSFEAMAASETPLDPEFAARVRFLGAVILYLKGAKSPAQILTGDWDPAGKDAQSVLEHARSLSSSPAT